MKDKYSVIYAPKGKASEYAELAVNLYNGCQNRCRYCYVPGCLRMDRAKFHGQYEPRKDILAKIEEDLCDMKLLGDDRKVLMCFTCDPYPKAGWRPGDDSITTRAAMRLFADFGRNFVVLTKSGMAGYPDFELYKRGDRYGATLTCFDPALSREWEPLAAEPQLRIAGLEEAAKRDIYTWVSFEPTIFPEQVYKLYDATKEFVIEYGIGTLNYMQPPAPVDYRRFAETMIEKCERDGKKYNIKADLRKYLQPEAERMK